MYLYSIRLYLVVNINTFLYVCLPFQASTVLFVGLRNFLLFPLPFIIALFSPDTQLTRSLIYMFAFSATSIRLCVWGNERRIKKWDCQRTAIFKGKPTDRAAKEQELLWVNGGDLPGSSSSSAQSIWPDTKPKRSTNSNKAIQIVVDNRSTRANLIPIFNYLFVIV